MGKLILLLCIPSMALALSVENTLQNDPILLQEVLSSKTSPKSVPFEKIDSGKILKDPKDLISDTFDIPKYFEVQTRFWFDIYTQHASTHSVLHDKENLAIVYDVLDFSSIDGSGLNQFTRAALQVKYVEKIVANYKQAFAKLREGSATGELEAKIEQALIKAGIKLPSPQMRKKFYGDLAANLRAQTGQKDNIQAGINAFARYEKTIRQYFEAFDVPWELRAITFLESSFNVRAKSKVGASGAWQFMRWIGAHFMEISRRQDGRSQPLMATAAALHLLRQNLKIMGRWDLAIAAYNSGTKHLLKGKRLMEQKKRESTLANILENYEHDHIGFASRNFYASFLALTRALAYADLFYEIPKPNEQVIHAYVSLCNISPQWFFNAMKKHDSLIVEENRHFERRYLKHQFPRGTALFTSANLTERRYKRIDPKDMPKRYPKNWKLLAKNHNCSTR